jgi:hypothetical protein
VVANHQPDEHPHPLEERRDLDRARQVGRLLRGRHGRYRLRALADPQRHRAAAEGGIDLVAEAAELGQADVRVALRRIGRRRGRRRIGVMRPRVEGERRIGERELIDEVARRMACRGLARSDRRLRARRLDRAVARLDQRGVRRGRVGGLQEGGAVRLVPDREEAGEGQAGVRARVPLRDGVRKRREVACVERWHVRPRAGVRPGRRPPQRQQHLDAALLGVGHELVEIRNVVRGVERVERLRGPAARDLVPAHDRACDRRVGGADVVPDREPVRSPAQRLVVEEAQ